MKIRIAIILLLVGSVIFMGLRGYHNKPYDYLVHTVTIAADSSDVTSATKFVTFSTTFDNVPVVLVVPPFGVDGTWSAGTITTTSCSVSVDTCPDQAAKSFSVVIIPHERL